MHMLLQVVSCCPLRCSLAFNHATVTHNLVHVLFNSSANFKQVLSETLIHKRVPFDFNSNFVKLYFGQKLNIDLNYHEFCQLLQVLLLRATVYTHVATLSRILLYVCTSFMVAEVTASW